MNVDAGYAFLAMKDANVAIGIPEVSILGSQSWLDHVVGKQPRKCQTIVSESRDSLQKSLGDFQVAE